MSKGATTVAELARAVESLKRRDRETRARMAKIESATASARQAFAIIGATRPEVVNLPRGAIDITRLPTTNSSPPALPVWRTTSGAALGAARSFFSGARHSVTAASSFFRRRVSSFFILKNKGDAR